MSSFFPAPVCQAHGPLTRQDSWAGVVDFSGDPVTGKDGAGERRIGASLPQASTAGHRGAVSPFSGLQPSLPHTASALHLQAPALPPPTVVSVWTVSIGTGRKWAKFMRMSIYKDGSSADRPGESPGVACAAQSTQEGWRHGPPMRGPLQLHSTCFPEHAHWAGPGDAATARLVQGHTTSWGRKRGSHPAPVN